MTILKPIVKAGRHAALLAVVFTGMTAPGQEQTVFEDSFEEFKLGEKWMPLAAGEPDGSLGLLAAGEDGFSLRMSTVAGDANELLGIGTSPIPLAGVTAVRVEVRFRPLNQTGAGDGGASDASVGMAVFGETGAFARVSAAANRPELPDWGDFYWDSEGGEDTSSPPWLHFPPNDPEGSAESFRTHILEIGGEGTALTTLGSGGEPLETTPFDISNPNLKLSDFGESITVGLFQLRSEDETSLGDVDYIVVRVEAEPRPIQITSFMVQKAESAATITFESKANATYAVEASGDLRQWIELTDGLESEGATTTFVEDAVPPDAIERFYRVREEVQ